MKRRLLILLCSASLVLAAAEESLPTLKTQVTQLEQKASELKDLLQTISRFNPDSMNSSELHEKGENLIEAIAELQKTKALLQERKQAHRNTIENMEREGKIEALKRDINRLEWDLIAEEGEEKETETCYQKETEDSVLFAYITSSQSPQDNTQKQEMLQHKKQELEQLLNNNQ